MEMMGVDKKKIKKNAFYKAKQETQSRDSSQKWLFYWTRREIKAKTHAS